MKFILVIMLFIGVAAKAQINSSLPLDDPKTNEYRFLPTTVAQFDSVTVNHYLIDGKQALTLSSKGESVKCICLLKDDSDTRITSLFRKKDTPLFCPWPYTKLEADKSTK